MSYVSKEATEALRIEQERTDSINAARRDGAAMWVATERSKLSDKLTERNEFRNRAKQFEARRREIASIAAEERRQREVDLVLNTPSAQAIPGLEFSAEPMTRKSIEQGSEFLKYDGSKAVPRLSASALKLSGDGLSVVQSFMHDQNGSDTSSIVPSPGVPIVKRQVNIDADNSNSEDSSHFDLSGIVTTVTEFLNRRQPMVPPTKTITPPEAATTAAFSKLMSLSSRANSRNKKPEVQHVMTPVATPTTLTPEQREERLKAGREFLATQQQKREIAHREEAMLHKHAEEQKVARLQALRERALLQRRKGAPAAALQRLTQLKEAREKALNKLNDKGADDSDLESQPNETVEPPELLQSADQRRNARVSLNVAIDGDEAVDSSRKVISKQQKQSKDQPKPVRKISVEKRDEKKHISASILSPEEDGRGSADEHDGTEARSPLPSFREVTQQLQKAQSRLSMAVPPVDVELPAKSATASASPMKAKTRFTPSKVSIASPTNKSKKGHPFIRQMGYMPRQSSKARRAVPAAQGSATVKRSASSSALHRNVQFAPPDAALRAASKVTREHAHPTDVIPKQQKLIRTIIATDVVVGDNLNTEEADVFDLLNNSNVIEQSHAKRNSNTPGSSARQTRKTTKRASPRKSEKLPMLESFPIAKSLAEETQARVARIAESRAKYSGLKVFTKKSPSASPASAKGSPFSSPKHRPGSPISPKAIKASSPRSPKSPIASAASILADQEAVAAATARVAQLTSEMQALQDEFGRRVQEAIEIEATTDMSDIEQVKAELATRLASDLLPQRAAQRYLKESEDHLRSLSSSSHWSPSVTIPSPTVPRETHLSALQVAATEQILSPSADVQTVTDAIAGQNYGDEYAENLSTASEEPSSVETLTQNASKTAPLFNKDVMRTSRDALSDNLSLMQEFSHDFELKHRQAMIRDRVTFSARLEQIHSEINTDMVPNTKPYAQTPDILLKDDSEVHAQLRPFVGMSVPSGGARAWFKTIEKGLLELNPAPDSTETTEGDAERTRISNEEIIKTILAARYSLNGEFQMYDNGEDSDESEDGEEYKRLLLQSQRQENGDEAFALQRAGGRPEPEDTDSDDDENNILHVFASEIVRQKQAEIEGLRAKHAVQLTGMLDKARSNSEVDKENTKNASSAAVESKHTNDQPAESLKALENHYAAPFWGTLSTRSPLDRRYNSNLPYGDEATDIVPDSSPAIPVSVLRSLDAVTSESPDKHSTNVEINGPQDVPSLDSDALQNALLAAYHPSDWLRIRLTTDLRSESTFSRENNVNQPSLAADSTGASRSPLSDVRVTTTRQTPTELRERMQAELQRQDQIQNFEIELTELEQAYTLATTQAIVKELNLRTEQETLALRQEQELALRQQAYELSLTTAVTSVQVAMQQETVVYEQRLRELEAAVQDREGKLVTALQTLNAERDAASKANSLAIQTSSIAARIAPTTTSTTNSDMLKRFSKSEIIQRAEKDEEEAEYSAHFDEESQIVKRKTRGTRGDNNLSTVSAASIRTERSVQSERSVDAEDVEDHADDISVGDEMSTSLAQSIQESFALGTGSVAGEIQESSRLNAVTKNTNTSRQSVGENEYSDVFDEFYSDEEDLVETDDRALNQSVRSSGEKFSAIQVPKSGNDHRVEASRTQVQFSDSDTKQRIKHASNNAPASVNAAQRLLADYREEMEKRLRSSEKELNMKIAIVRAQREKRLAAVNIQRSARLSKSQTAALDIEVRTINADYASARAEIDRERWNVNARAYKELRKYNAFKMQVGIDLGLSQSVAVRSGSTSRSLIKEDESGHDMKPYTKQFMQTDADDSDVSVSSSEDADSRERPSGRIVVSTSAAENSNNEISVSQSSFSISTPARGTPVGSSISATQPAESSTGDITARASSTRSVITAVSTAAQQASSSDHSESLGILNSPSSVVRSSVTSPAVTTASTHRSPQSLMQAQSLKIVISPSASIPVSPQVSNSSTHPVKSPKSESPQLTAAQSARLAAIKHAMLYGQDDDLNKLLAAADADELALHDDSWDSEADGGVAANAVDDTAVRPLTLTTFNYYARSVLAAGAGGSGSILVQDVAAIVIQSAVRRHQAIRRVFPTESINYVPSGTGAAPLLLRGNLARDALQATLAEDEVLGNSFCSENSDDGYNSEEQEDRLSYALQLALQELATEKRSREAMDRVRQQQQEALLKRQNAQVEALSAYTALKKQQQEHGLSVSSSQILSQDAAITTANLHSPVQAALVVADGIERRLAAAQATVKAISTATVHAVKSPSTGADKVSELSADLSVETLSPKHSHDQQKVEIDPLIEISRQSSKDDSNHVEVSSAVTAIASTSLELGHQLHQLSTTVDADVDLSADFSVESSSESSQDDSPVELSASFSSPKPKQIAMSLVSPLKPLSSTQGVQMETEVRSDESLQSDDSISVSSEHNAESTSVSAEISATEQNTSRFMQSPSRSPEGIASAPATMADVSVNEEVSVDIVHEQLEDHSVDSISVSSSESSVSPLKLSDAEREVQTHDVPVKSAADLSDSEEEDVAASDSFAATDSVSFATTHMQDEDSVSVDLSDKVQDNAKSVVSYVQNNHVIAVQNKGDMSKSHKQDGSIEIFYEQESPMSPVKQEAVSPGMGPPSTSSHQSHRSPHRILSPGVSPAGSPSALNRKVSAPSSPVTESHRSSPQASPASPVRLSGASSPSAHSPSSPTSPMQMNSPVLKARTLVRSPSSSSIVTEAMSRSPLYVDTAVFNEARPKSVSSPVQLASPTSPGTIPGIFPPPLQMTASPDMSHESSVLEELQSPSASYSASFDGETSVAGPAALLSVGNAEKTPAPEAQEADFSFSHEPVSDTSDVNLSLDAPSHDGLSVSIEGAAHTAMAPAPSEDFEGSESTVNVHVRLDQASKNAASFVSPVKEHHTEDETSEVEMSEPQEAKASFEEPVDKALPISSPLDVSIDSSISKSEKLVADISRSREGLEDSIAEVSQGASASGLLDASDLRALEEGAPYDMDSSMSMSSSSPSPSPVGSPIREKPPLPEPLQVLPASAPAHLADLPTLATSKPDAHLAGLPSLTKPKPEPVVQSDDLDDYLYEFDDIEKPKAIASSQPQSKSNQPPAPTSPPVAVPKMQLGASIGKIAHALISHKAVEAEILAQAEGVISPSIVPETVFHDVAAHISAEEAASGHLKETSLTSHLVHAVHDRMTEILREVLPIGAAPAPAIVGRTFNNSLSARLIASTASDSQTKRTESARALLQHHLAQQSHAQQAVQEGSRRYLDFVEVPFLDSFKDGVALAMDKSAEEIADVLLEQAMMDAVEEYNMHNNKAKNYKK